MTLTTEMKDELTKILVRVAILAAIIAFAAMLAGCSSTNITKLVGAMAKDTNSIVIEVKSIYGTVTVYRNIPYKLSVVP